MEGDIESIEEPLLNLTIITPEQLHRLGDGVSAGTQGEVFQDGVFELWAGKWGVGGGVDGCR